MWKGDMSDVKIQHIYVYLNHLLPILNEYHSLNLSIPSKIVQF